MNLEYSDEQQALRDIVRAFLGAQASISGHVRPLIGDPTGWTEPVWRGLTQIGAPGVLVPEHCGGAGMSMAEAGIVAEELGAGLYPGPWLSTAVTATRLLTRTGADADIVLRGIADGSVIATVGGLTGPRPTGITTASGHLLTGDLGAVPDALAARTLLVLADEPSGTGLFAVSLPASGVTATAQIGIDGTRKQVRVELNGVDAQRLATVSPETLDALVDDVLIAHAADALGAARAVLGLAVDYAKTRQQFGQPIGAFQAVQHLCVDMYETVELARSGVLHALWAADSAPPAERHLAAVRCKAFAGRLAQVGDTAIQVFGGIGYTWEHDAQLYLKRLLSFSSLLGGPDHYLKELGSQLITRRTR
ncbi:acyl-CoA dehydrogenase family protein [Micromonospora sp. WMMD736]|uniref:acyl-CoA dehydrogenase family protein n=1 Tax=Micromonospora sp. WMMD736 TaxID=3404112 RepID=UPI003B964FE4